MSQSKEQEVSLGQFLEYVAGWAIRELFPKKQIPRLEELTSRRLIYQTASILNGPENAEFQKLESKDGNMVASFLTSEKYTAGTEIHVVLSETFKRNWRKETIKTNCRGIVSRIRLQKKHKSYLIDVKLHVYYDE